MNSPDHRHPARAHTPTYALTDLDGDARRRAQDNADAFLDRGVRDGVHDEAARALLTALHLGDLEPAWDLTSNGGAVEGQVTLAGLTASRAALKGATDPFAPLWETQLSMLLLSAREADVPGTATFTLNADLRHRTYRTVVTADVPPAVMGAAQAAFTHLSYQLLTRVREADRRLNDPAELSALLMQEGVAFDQCGHVRRLPRTP